jgi:hypothetical protein
LFAPNGALILESAKVLDEPLGVLDSRPIRFTQDSIASKFKGRDSLQDTIEALSEGRISADDFPPIRIFEMNGLLFTLDNRRLYVFQQLGLPIKTIPATMQEIQDESFKFTTSNGGASVRVRGGG